MIKGICHVVGAGDFSPELLDLKEGDLVIVMGAGDIYKAGEALVK